MKIIKFPKFKDYKNQVVRYLQPKLDGILTKIYKDKSDGLSIFTKNDKDITTKVMSINHIKEVIDILPWGSTLFGELHCPGVPATSIVTMLNDANQRLRLTVFAAPMLGGVDFTNAGLQSVMNMLGSYGFGTPGTTDIQVGCNGLTEKRKEELLRMAIENKFEGWVLKQEHMSGWFKLKPVRTVDAFVIETYESDSDRYKGGLKCIRVGVWKEDGTLLDLGTAGNGFKLEFRMQLMTQEKRNGLLDKVCEIAYDSVAAKGKLRFPRFIRWRDDKDKIDCTEEQLK